MRIRQVRPEFWSDAKVGRLPDAVRLFYIGLWNLADDEGWLAWDAADAGALLYPFRAVARRERELTTWLDELAAETRVERWSCGCVQVLRLAEHQRISGVKSTKARDAHKQHHSTATQIPLSDKQSPRNGSDKQSPLSDKPVRVGNVSGYGREGYTRPLVSPSREAFPPIGSKRPVNPLGETA